MALSRRTVLKASGQALAILMAPPVRVTGAVGQTTARRRPAGQAAAPPAAAWAARLKELQQPGPRDLVLAATGDCLVNRKFSMHDDPAVRALFDVIRDAHVSLLNLEISLTRRGWPRQKDVIRADPSIVEELRWLGADVVSLGNNHSMDYGPEGLGSTLTTLDGARIKRAGAGQTAREALAPAVVSAGENNIAFLSFLCAFNVTDQRAGDTAPGVAAVGGYTVRTGFTAKEALTQSAPDAAQLRAMEEAIRGARRGNDLIVVSYHMHWGGRDAVDDGRRIITHAAIDAGADLVICHGPHVLHGIELYEDKYIFHSLGNFFFQMPVAYWELFPSLQELVTNFYGRTAYWQTVVPRITFRDRKMSRIELLPAVIAREGERLGCPQIAEDARGREILDEMATLSKPFGVSVTQSGWYGTVDKLQST